MNTPEPTPSNSGVLLPSTGSLIGGALGIWAATALHLNPADPLTGGSLVTATATLGTALLHWFGVKFKIPGL